MTLVCVNGGVMPSAGVQLDADWNLRLDSTNETLRLNAVCKSERSGNVYYVFCGHGNSHTCWLDDRPAFLKELLLPLPAVLLRRSALGFHMLSKSDWDMLLQEEAPGNMSLIAPGTLPPPECEETASSALQDTSDIGSVASRDDSSSDSSSSFEVTDDEEDCPEEVASETELLDEACAVEG